MRTHRVWPWISIAILHAGCAAAPDAPDAADDPASRLDDIPPSCTLAPAMYRITRVDASTQDDTAIDLDGDGRPDDRLGTAAASIAYLEPAFAIDPRFRARLEADVPWLIEVDACPPPADGAPVEARVSVAQGIATEGGLGVAHTAARAVGWIANGALTARDGQASFPLAALADVLRTTADPGWLEGDGAMVRATVTPGTFDGVIGAALITADAQDALAPPIAAFVTTQPPGDPLRAAADADHDGTVTAAELAATETFQALTAADVVIRAPDGTPRGDMPRTSIALHFVAQRASGTELRASASP